ncbi:MAG TPA: bifunctional UDP-N-acetylmuramoyl-tripeptide:D-alanyl-D-alanine ligase/alanine racemase [Cytophagales bacterium]|jgi:alanine racemase|nr:bifunctional UDP-N-acetylmuramoyl-tripeptide:D-alanyl-D-alanine ligase/alanine racemase [Cytophagales bacterium]
MIRFSELVAATGGKIISSNHNTDRVSQWIIDSRKASIHAEAIFAAFEGDHHDGHAFIQNLYDQGLRQFLVSKTNSISENILSQSNVLQVDDVLVAIQLAAKTYRNSLDHEIWAVTGSNGKTIVKEWLSQLLSTELFTYKSPKSYNSQLGVPLSILGVPSGSQMSIIEAGISQKGEMSKLAEMIKPVAGIFTNIGKAHDEGFKSRQEKAREKWRLFEQCEKVIYCKDHSDIDVNRPESIKTFVTWGAHRGSDLQILNKGHSPNKTLIKGLWKTQEYHFSLPFTDQASIENALHCITLLLLKGYDEQFINSRLSRLHNVPMRLQIIHGMNGNYIIDDTYNNDLTGLDMALGFLMQQTFSDQKRVILSDIPQTGLDNKTLYSEVALMLKNKGDFKVIGIGPAISAASNYFTKESEFYETTEQFLQTDPEKRLSNEVILIKGARKFQFEKVVKKFSKKIHSTVLEINLDALLHNLNFYRSQLQDHTKILVMVKALAYGSGNHEVATLLQQHLVDYLGVAFPDEGVHLRQNGIKLPIMVLNVEDSAFDKIIDYKLEPEMYCIRQLRSFAKIAGKLDEAVKIHLKFDTGMHRLGFEWQHIDELIALLIENPKLEVASVFTHLAGADESEHNSFSRKQVEEFRKMATLVENKLNISPIKHVLNSAGIIRFPQYQMDMVRLGIGLYGFESNQIQEASLKPISTLKSTISQIKKLKKGETVGYSRKGKVEKDSTIATIAIGYADGYSRAFSNGVGKVLVNGHLAPVIGNVCMDMTMIDISGIDAEEGDEVIIFGEQPTIKDLAGSIGTIPYEILTNVSERVNRIYFSA